MSVAETSKIETMTQDITIGHPTNPLAFDPIETLKATNSVSINFLDHMDQTLFQRNARMRFANFTLRLKDENKVTIQADNSIKNKVRVEVRLPTEFTDQDVNYNQFNFVAYRYRCYVEYWSTYSKS